MRKVNAVLGFMTVLAVALLLSTTFPQLAGSQDSAAVVGKPNAPAEGKLLVIGWGAKYKYKEVAHWGIGTFQKRAYSDAAWPSYYAGFGVTDARCALSSCCVKTWWGGQSDMLLRKWFFAPSTSGGYVVTVAVDNAVQVFINGMDISGGMKSRTGCPVRGNFAFAVPSSYLYRGTNNLLAIRAADFGGLRYIDAKVTRQY
jgi:hypothetical protein